MFTASCSHKAAAGARGIAVIFCPVVAVIIMEIIFPVITAVPFFILSFVLIFLYFIFYADVAF